MILYMGSGSPHQVSVSAVTLQIFMRIFNLIRMWTDLCWVASYLVYSEYPELNSMQSAVLFSTSGSALSLDPSTQT